MGGSMKSRAFLAANVVLAGGIAVAWPAVALGQQAVSYRVVVHPTNAIAELSAVDLAQVFLKTRVQWINGQAIEPVDLNVSTATRKVFSTDVFGRSATEIQAHWQQQIFSGQQVPPLELGDDAAVVRYVSSHPGAIGYVNASTQLVGVRAVPLTLPAAQLSVVEARYTPMARRLRVEGSVVLRVAVRRDGSVGGASVISGLPHGLTEAAIEAVKQWKFRPALQANQPVDSTLNVTVIFRL